jgi:hypothetical protein
VFAELVEHPKGCADFAGYLVVATEGRQADLDVADPCAGVLGGSMPRRPRAVVETVITARVGLSPPTASRVRSARSTLRRAVRSSVTLKCGAITRVTSAGCCVFRYEGGGGRERGVVGGCA